MSVWKESNWRSCGLVFFPSPPTIKSKCQFLIGQFSQRCTRFHQYVSPASANKFASRVSVHTWIRAGMCLGKLHKYKCKCTNIYIVSKSILHSGSRHKCKSNKLCGREGTGRTHEKLPSASGNLVDRPTREEKNCRVSWVYLFCVCMDLGDWPVPIITWEMLRTEGISKHNLSLAVSTTRL